MCFCIVCVDAPKCETYDTYAYTYIMVWSRTLTKWSTPQPWMDRVQCCVFWPANACACAQEAHVRRMKKNEGKSWSAIGSDSQKLVDTQTLVAHLEFCPYYCVYTEKIMFFPSLSFLPYTKVPLFPTYLCLSSWFFQLHAKWHHIPSA